MDIKVIKKTNKSGREYLALGVDLEYDFKVLSFNPQDIAEICGVSVRELYELVQGSNGSLAVGLIKI